MYRIISFSPPLTGFVLAILCTGVLFIGREYFEGLPYNVSLASQHGDLALIACVVMAAVILKQPDLQLAPWLTRWQAHLVCALAAIAAGVAFQAINMIMGQKSEWIDTYHNFMVLPLLMYLLATTLPVLWINGSRTDKAISVCLLLFWFGLLVYDINHHRLNQRAWLKSQGVTWTVP